MARRSQGKKKAPKPRSPSPGVFAAPKSSNVFETGARFDFRSALVVAGLVALTLIVFFQTAWFDFINYDDDFYITDNPHTQAGLSWKNVVWAFTTGHASNWHPVTWLSHMLDVQIFGMNAGAHHLVNVFIHVLNVVLLFYLLKKMTGALGPSAFVAGLFAVHPLHVESVAWIAERKDVLSTCFWLLTTLAYVRYARGRRIYYLLVMFLYGLGLMAKPMLVTLPAVLLLLDYWPLGRFKAGERPVAKQAVFLLIEKLPLFAFAIGSSIVTYLAQKAGKTVATLDVLSFSARADNAVVSYAKYMLMAVCPRRLAVFYPHPGDALPMWQVIVAGLALAGLTAGVIFWARRHPYLLTGWFWYLGTLLPVIGLVQVGNQALADRYTYVSLIGVFIIAAWGLRDLFMSNPVFPKLGIASEPSLGFGKAGLLLAAVETCVVLVLAGFAAVQTSYWRNGETLFGHAIAVGQESSAAFNNLGRFAHSHGRNDEAKAYLTKALNLEPNLGNALYNLGVLAMEQRHFDEANAHLTKALGQDPKDVKILNLLGVLASEQGHYDEAKDYLTKAVASDPENADAHNNLGWCLVNQGQYEEAQLHFRKALEIDPRFTLAMNNLGEALAKLGRQEEANVYFKRAHDLTPAADLNHPVPAK